MTDDKNSDVAICGICGEPMPPGEQMFKFHGYSGPCPKPPLPKRTPRAEPKVVQMWDALCAARPSLVYAKDKGVDCESVIAEVDRAIADNRASCAPFWSNPESPMSTP